MTRLPVAALLLALPALAADAPVPPQSPERSQKPLEAASAVAQDLAKTVLFLEQGQAYYKAYAKGTHTAADNKAFVRFAEDYDHELAIAKKELEVLRLWVEKKSELKPE